MKAVASPTMTSNPPVGQPESPNPAESPQMIMKIIIKMAVMLRIHHLVNDVRYLIISAVVLVVLQVLVVIPLMIGILYATRRILWSSNLSMKKLNLLMMNHIHPTTILTLPLLIPMTKSKSNPDLQVANCP